MTTILEKVDNQLAILLPESLSSFCKMQVGEVLDILVEENRIVITSAKVSPRYTLEELISNINTSNVHGEVSFGQAIGNEIW